MLQVNSSQMVADEMTLLEGVIQKGKEAYESAGLALREIRDRRGYRLQGYATFEDYMEGRWGWSGRQGYYLIQAVEVAKNVNSSSHSIPPSFTQARVLAPLPPERQREIASQVDFGETTVRELRSIVREAQQDVAAIDRAAPAGFDPVANRVAMETRQHLYHAIGLIAGLPEPHEMARMIPAHSADQLDGLEVALGWLNEFARAWRPSHVAG